MSGRLTEDLSAGMSKPGGCLFRVSADVSYAFITRWILLAAYGTVVVGVGCCATLADMCVLRNAVCLMLCLPFRDQGECKAGLRPGMPVRFVLGTPLPCRAEHRLVHRQR